MAKKLFILLMAVLMCLMLPLTSLANVDMDGNPLPVYEKPESISVRSTDLESELLIRYTHSDRMAELIYDQDDDWETPFIELDIKINDGDWTFNRTPGGFRTDTLETLYEELLEDLWPGIAGSFVLYPGSTIHDDLHSYDSWLYSSWLGLGDSWDLANNTISFRFRYVYEYEFLDAASDTYGFKDVVSPWSDVASIGKGASSELPEKLNAPENLKGELLKDKDGKPYFHFTYTIPDDVKLANRQTEIENCMDWKVGASSWSSERDLMYMHGGSILTSTMDVNPIEKEELSTVNIDKNTYAFRMCFQFKRPDGSIYRSPFSNIVILGVDAWSKTATWAEDIMKKAYGYGLIPDSLMGKDLTAGITRAEFAAVSVKVYEALSGNSATPVAVNPFTDTSDPEVLKAYNVGITAGVSSDKFAPNTLLNREQAATMLTRVYKKISMPGWTLSDDGKFTLSYTKPAVFSDDNKISTWAKDSVYFMAANGIITGTGNNMFTPRATTPAEEAMNYATAAREQALTMAVRMVENLK